MQRCGSSIYNEQALTAKGGAQGIYAAVRYKWHSHRKAADK